MTKKAQIITILTIILFLAGLTILSLFNNRDIPQNVSGTVGNTAGNLYNGGSFCEASGIVFFANPYDNDAIYRMNADTSNMVKISDTPASYLNVGGNYLYYYRSHDSEQGGSGLGYVVSTSGLYRSELDGDGEICLFQGNMGTPILVDNNLYFMNLAKDNYLTFFKTPIQKEKDAATKVNDLMIHSCSAANGIIYYNGNEDDHYLYAYNTQTQQTTTLLAYDLWNPTFIQTSIYYMDIHYQYRLCRYDLETETATVLTSDRVDFYNVIGDYVYYQTSGTSTPALKRVHTDGSGEEVVMEGTYSNLQTTSTYVYFQAYEQPVPLYMTPTFGAVSITTFEAAKNAVLNQ